MEFDYVLVDASNLAYRHWWNCRHLTSPDGTPSGLEYGFFQGLLSVARIYVPAKVVLVWDGRPTKGLNLFAGYKDRTSSVKDGEPAWPPRLANLRQTLVPLVRTVFEENTEADHEIARLLVELKDKQCLIWSNDLDFHQLVGPNVYAWNAKEKAVPYDEPKVMEKWGVSGRKLLLRRALEGDKSDKLPGVLRLTSKLKVSLVQEATDLDDLFSVVREGRIKITDSQREKILACEEQIRINYEIMNLLDETDKADWIDGTVADPTLALKMCQQIGADSLLQRREWQQCF